jgi:hypothetical protein
MCRFQVARRKELKLNVKHQGFEKVCSVLCAIFLALHLLLGLYEY